jgi:hypothetical protein
VRWDVYFGVRTGRHFRRDGCGCQEAEICYIWFTCLRIWTKYWSPVNISMRLIFGIDIFITEKFFTILVSIVG